MTASCPLCSKNSPQYFSATDLNQEISREKFCYYRCPSCELIFMSPVPDDLGSYYLSTYPAYQMPTLQDLAVKAELERYKLDLVQRFITKGRLLEIGPAYGGFAYLAKQAGFEVDTIEMDAACCRFLTDVVGVHAIHSTNIPHALNAFRSYNVITLWHVIEHLTEPWETMRVISDKLAPGGIVVIAAPNPSSIQFKIFGRHWIHVDAPRHLQLIPTPLLVQFMESHGLKAILSTTKERVSTVFHSLGWWIGSFRNTLKALDPAFQKKPVHFVQSRTNKSNTLSDSLAGTTLLRLKKLLILPFALTKIFFITGLRFMFFLILKPFERLEGLGCAYTVILKKGGGSLQK